MRLEELDLRSGLIPLVVDEGNPVYQRIMARLYAEVWRAYHNVWKMHGINGQFTNVEINGELRNGIPATKHCVAQAVRAQALAKMLGLPDDIIRILVEGVLLTDSYKFREWCYMQEVGPSWGSYADAQDQAKKTWVDSGMFSREVLVIASSVAHETLITMELLCDAFERGTLTHLQIAQLIAHYVDDISANHAWVTQRAGNTNVLTERILVRNASNPTYRRLNAEGKTRLHQDASRMGFDWLFTDGETTYEAQARVGISVQAVLAEMLQARLGGRQFHPFDLPVIIDNYLRRIVNQACEGGLDALRVKPFLERI